MGIGWLWLFCAITCLINLLLLVWSLRLQMEVWANRRVIAALEAALHHSDRKGPSNRTNGVSFVFVLVALVQLLLLWREFWR
jgi:hypothetical protein